MDNSFASLVLVASIGMVASLGHGPLATRVFRASRGAGSVDPGGQPTSAER